MKPKDLRIPALRRFAVAITILNLLGHTVLGFESSWAQTFVTVLAAYLFEIVLEWLDARARGRAPRYRGGGFTNLVNFLLPAHITGLAISMLLYCSDLLLPFVFAAAVGICSKAVLTAPVGNSSRHFLNPSNTGIALTALLFPWTAVTLPYQFTERLTGPLDWGLPALIVVTGSFLNSRFTKRMPLLAGWVSAFFLQALVRSLVFGTTLAPKLAPMVGVAFVLFTFYMVTDPGTTPKRPRNQVIFGVGVGIAYGLLVMLHVTYALFIALLVVCTVRGLVLHAVRALKGAKESGRELAGTADAPAAVSAQFVPSPSVINAPVAAGTIISDPLE